MSLEFYLHEDDWNMVAFEPAENRSERVNVLEEARLHGEQHRAPGGIGWTAMYVAPPAPVGIATRGLHVTGLSQLLGAEWIAFERVTSGYGSQREAQPRAFAMASPRRAAPPSPVIYGTAEAGVVTSLAITTVDRIVAADLVRLGTAHRLIICDLWHDQCVELTSADSVERYLQLLEAE